MSEKNSTHASYPILYLLILFSLTSCGPKKLSEKEMYAYIQEENHGFAKSKTVNGFKIKVSLRPVDLIALQEAKGEKDVKKQKSKFDSAKKDFNHYCYFVLSLSADNKEVTTQEISSQAELNQRIIDMSYNMKDYVFITSEKSDTVFATDFVYERTYELGPSSNFLFVFDRAELLKCKEVQFNVIDIGLGTGDNKFLFERWVLLNEPILK